MNEEWVVLLHRGLGARREIVSTHLTRQEADGAKNAKDGGLSENERLRAFHYTVGRRPQNG